MTTFSVFDLAVLEKLSHVLADTSTGLTNSEIGSLLHDCGIPDVGVAANKRTRLLLALRQKQTLDRSGNCVADFLCRAMSPVRYVSNQQVFEARRTELNLVLSFVGLTLGADGQLRSGAAIKTLTEAQARFGRLRQAMLSRNIHPEVVRFCKPELLDDDCFHAVFEACKGVAERIRDLSGLTTDGPKLVDEAFGGTDPLLVFNTRRTETEQSEHSGIMNLAKGMFGVFRNTTAHAPKVRWIISEEDALDLFSIASLISRRLDRCVKTR